MDENDGEWQEEELLVYLDFNSKIDDDLVSVNKEFKIIGIDSDCPVLQLSNQVFQGEWKDAIGTQVVFEEDENPPRADPLFSDSPKSYLKYLSKTNKILSMSRVFVNPKGEKITVDRNESLSDSN